MKQVHLNLPEPIIEWLKNIAKESDTSMAEHVRRAIVEYKQRLQQMDQQQKK